MNTTLLTTFSNDIGEDGWAHLAPIGDFPGIATMPDGTRKKAIQRIDKEAIANMVEEFKSSRKGLRFLNTRPIYKGHPDLRGAERRFPDKSPKGVFANLAIREAGLFGEPVFTDEGLALIANGHNALSGLWTGDIVGEENGVPIYRPTKFLSAGLTPTPNLPVQLLNEKEEQTNTHTTMLKKLIPLLTLLGITVANEATEAEVETALDSASKKLNESKTTLANEKSKLETDLATTGRDLATAKTELANTKTTLETRSTELTTTQAAFANERKARIGILLANALRDLRITAAEQPDWERRLQVEASFANEVEALGKLTPRMNAKSITITRGERKVELANAAERRDMIQQVITEICHEQKWDRSKDYDRAFNEAQKRHPVLFVNK